VRLDVHHHLEPALFALLEVFMSETLHNQRKIMASLTALQASVTRLETQNAVNKQLILDLIAAVNAANTGGIPQSDVDALQERVDAVVTGETADDTAGQGALTPPGSGAPAGAAAQQADQTHDGTTSQVDPNAPRASS
jgi:hypothetical protein